MRGVLKLVEVNSCLVPTLQTSDNFVEQHFWARGYFVSTLDRDEEVIGEYTKIREKEDERLDQLGLWR